MSENHLIFSDESGYNGNHRYGAIAIVSGSKSDTKSLNEELSLILQKYSKTELKFAKAKGHSSTLSVIKEFVSLGLQYCSIGKIKIHVIVWDKKDSRHQVQGCNDIENLKRMYYHILKKTKTDWHSIIDWEFYPDEFSGINWRNDIVKYIEHTNLDKQKHTNQSALFELFSNFRFPMVHKQGELQSEKYPILQLADLFVGIVRLSYECGEKYNIWLSNELQRNTLFPDLLKCNSSKNEKSKFKILQHFKDTSSKYKLGVNFSKNQYFTTFSSKHGILIWLYKPQGEYDKAPRKKKIWQT